MYGHTVEKSRLKGYNYNTLYTIGRIKMDRITQSMLDAFQNDFLNDDYKCEKTFKGIVDFIISKGQDIDIENRKCFERKETTEYLLSQKESLIEYLKTDNVIS